ncbi:styrene monooxygenase/indole monooxygenase family protein [Soonwooa purpurea]
MSRKVSIVGAGQSGLQLGLGLVQKGYDVTIYSNRTPEQIKNGKVMSSQCMFDMALENERELGINYWEDTCPPVEGLGITVPHPEKPGEKLFTWAGKLDKPAYAVDQRIKMLYWMEKFEEMGGKIIIKDVDENDLEDITAESDLTILAAGKGSIVQMFERDAEKSMYDKPMRALALTYVKNMEPNKPFSKVAFNLIPGVGEYFVFPSETINGPCEIMVLEGIVGGPMDCWQDIKTPEEHLAKSLEILKTYLPWEYERCKNVELTDDNGILAGRFAPTVRKPIATLPSGRKVFGIADVVVVNDPITGQGSNNASKCTKIYYDSILERGDQAFDEAWMQGTFDQYWEAIKDVAFWTNTLLGPPPPHILKFLGAAASQPKLAHLFANNFNDPRQFFPWWLDPVKTDELIAENA